MLRLHQYAPAWGLLNPSPFCLKLETYLRMAHIPYEAVTVLDPRGAPKGKLPYVTDGEQVIADSNFIIEYLVAAYGDKLDRHLPNLQRAYSLALRRLIEENLYWSVVYSRWIEDKGWLEVKQEFFRHLRAPLKWFVPSLARRSVKNQLFGHGIGRHNRNEIYKIGMADLTALSEALGDKVYFFGDRPSSLDASAYGLLANILWTPIKNPLKDWLQTLPNLIAFCHTVRDRYYLHLEERQLELAVS